MKKYLPAQDASQGINLWNEVGSFLDDFCKSSGFMDVKTGRTKIARATNLALQGDPKTMAEERFLDALLTELDRHFTAADYPKSCLRLATASRLGATVN